MDEEIYELGRELDLDYEDAEKLQDIINETGLDTEEAIEILDEY